MPDLLNNNLDKLTADRIDYFHSEAFILQWSISDLQEVLHTFRVIAVTLPADSLHLFDLACLAGGLDIFEVDLWILAEVHNRTQEVEQT